jgi:hypothetical protein
MIVAYLPRDWIGTVYIAAQGPLLSMRNDYSNKCAPNAPLCLSCAQSMRLARITSRFGDLPDLYTFECRACGVSHIEEHDRNHHHHAGRNSNHR